MKQAVAGVLLDNQMSTSPSSAGRRGFVVGLRHPRALLFGLAMAAMFVLQDNVLDRDTYIFIVENIRNYDAAQFLLTFNGVEFGSMAAFYVLASTGLAAMTSLAFLVAAYSFLAMVRVRRVDEAVAFSVLAMFFYGFDAWTNQLRASLAISIALYVALRASEVRNSASLKDVALVAASALFHIQSVVIAAALAVNSRPRAAVALLAALALSFLPFEDLLGGVGGLALAAGKAGTYAAMEANVTASPIMKIRILGVAGLALYIIVKNKQTNLFAPLLYANGLLAVIFWNSPFIFGRLTSSLIFFEPFFMLRYFPKLRFAYLVFLAGTSAVKWSVR